MLGKLREKAGKYYLKKHMLQVQRQRQIQNIHTATSAGIVCTFDENTVTLNIIMQFRRYLLDHNIQTDVIGYFDKKRIPSIYLHTEGLRVFSRHDLSWCFLPDRKFVKDFINCQYDLLIDLSDNYPLPVAYILVLSKAKFKVGPFIPDTNSYDFMIDAKDKNLTFYIEQIKHFLLNINKMTI